MAGADGIRGRAAALGRRPGSDRPAPFSRDVLAEFRAVAAATCSKLIDLVPGADLASA